MTQESVAQKLAQDAVDGLLKQAGKMARQEVKEGEEVTIDPETQKKIIDREIKMAADPDFALAEEAKLAAADRMRRSRERNPESPVTKPVETDKVAINKEIGATAKTMLDMGIPPNVVAQYLVGSSTPQVPIAFAGGGNQGLTLTDVLTLVDRMNTNKANSELEKTISDMRDEIKSLKNQPRGDRLDPIETQTSQLEGLTKLVDSLVKLGVVKRPGDEVPSGGEPLEVVKEKNRHAEKLAEIQIDKTHKEALVNTLSEAAVNVGKGLASDARERSPRREQVAPTGDVESVECEACHTKIYYPRDATQITCPKCKTVYTRTPETPRELKEEGNK